MMKIESLKRLKAWFDGYARSYLPADAAPDHPLILKIEHTTRVCDNIRQLAGSLDLDADRVRLAEAIALFHDVGRFEQYRRYQTFSDARSVNHAAKGVEVLTQAGVLEPLADGDKAILVAAVRFHNAPALPENDGFGAMVFMRLIQDADKLDIWKVFADVYRQNTPRHPTIFQHCADLPTWEPRIVEAILQKRQARFKDMKTLNDIKLLHLSWLFGLHFPATAVLARERGHLAAIASSLPADPAIDRVVSMVMGELEEAGR